MLNILLLLCAFSGGVSCVRASDDSYKPLVEPEPRSGLVGHLDKYLACFDFSTLHCVSSLPFSQHIFAKDLRSKSFNLSKLLVEESFGCTTEPELPAVIAGVARIMTFGKALFMFVLSNNTYVLVNPENAMIYPIRLEDLGYLSIVAWYKNPDAV